LERARGCLVVEMNAGQMLEDVRLAAQGHVPISFYGQMGGLIPDTEDILEAIDREYARWLRPQPVVSRSLVGEMP
jgi:2-oxoglutarate ferredoxin oxidoreductase subunit alpha